MSASEWFMLAALAVRGLLKRARALAWLIHAAPDPLLASTDELRAGLEGQ